MKHTQVFLSSIPSGNIIVWIVIGIIAFQTWVVARALRLKWKTDKWEKEQNEANKAVQALVNEMTVNAAKYTDNQRTKCLEVILNVNSPVKQEKEIRRILETGGWMAWVYILARCVSGFF